MAQKRVLYVGGLDDNVTVAILHAAFIPFGPIVDVQIPLDPGKQKNRGFGFVQFENEEDARAAMENMNDAELFGKVLRVSKAKPAAAQSNSGKAVWEEAEDWYAQLREDGFEAGLEGQPASDTGAAGGGGGGGGGAGAGGDSA